MLQFIVLPDGHDRQDGENAAAKRRLAKHGQRFSPLKVGVLGDRPLLPPTLLPKAFRAPIQLHPGVSSRISRHRLRTSERD